MAAPTLNVTPPFDRIRRGGKSILVNSAGHGVMDDLSTGIVHADSSGVLTSSPIVTGDITDGSLLLTDFASGVAATSYTPTLSGGGTAGTLSYSLRAGRYARIGPLVWASFIITVSAISVAPTGALFVSLPVTIMNDTGAFGVAGLDFSSVNLSAGYTNLVGRMVPNLSAVSLFEMGDNVGSQALTGTAVVVNFQVIGSTWYFAA